MTDMKLTITENAVSKIYEMNDVKDKYLLLRYDTDGCGCGVNGVPTLEIVAEKDEDHIDIENPTIPTIVNKMQSVFFAENMKLDFVNGMFRLSSPDGILNPFIPTNSVCSR